MIAGDGSEDLDLVAAETLDERDIVPVAVFLDDVPRNGHAGSGIDGAIEKMVRTMTHAADETLTYRGHIRKAVDWTSKEV